MSFCKTTLIVQNPFSISVFTVKRWKFLLADHLRIGVLRSFQTQIINDGSFLSLANKMVNSEIFSQMLIFLSKNITECWGLSIILFHFQIKN